MISLPLPPPLNFSDSFVAFYYWFSCPSNPHLIPPQTQVGSLIHPTKTPTDTIAASQLKRATALKITVLTGRARHDVARSVLPAAESRFNLGNGSGLGVISILNSPHCKSEVGQEAGCGQVWRPSRRSAVQK